MIVNTTPARFSSVRRRCRRLDRALRLSVGSALTVLSAASVAEAQTLRLPDPANTTVDQNQEEYQPLGIVAGTFIILPSIRTGLRLDDNVYARDHNKDGDATFVVAPDITATSQFPDRYISLQAGGEGAKYVNQTDNDYVDLYARATAIQNVFEQDRVGATFGVTRYHEDRTSADQEAFRKLTTITATGGSLTYHKGLDRLFIEGTGSAQYLSFDNPSEDVSDRNRIQTQLGVRAGYQVSPSIAAYGITTVRRNDYDQSVNNAGVKRSSTTYFGGVGTDVDITGLLFGSFDVGFVYRAYDGTDLNDVTGLQSDLNLTWNPTELTSVILNGRTSLQETTLTVDDDTASTDSYKSLSLTVIHALRPNVFLTATTRYIRDDYLDTDRADNTVQAGIGARWLINRRMSYDANYMFSKRMTNADDADYVRNVFLTGITLSF